MSDNGTFHRGQWSSQLGFILAAVGSAIGLGNIWRFPYMAYSNGGGAFLIPYLIALFTAGIPLLILEFAIGHERIGSAPLAYAKLHKNWEWLGWWAVMFVMFGIVLYYSSVIAWCVSYISYAAKLAWGNNPDKFFFNNVLGKTDSPWKLGGLRPGLFISLAFVWFINWFVIYKGIQKGLELANKIFMPVLFVLMAVLVVWGVRLPGASEGITAYLKPDLSKLADVKVWTSAYSQIFFSLSLGFGIMIAYASYLPEKSNLTGSAIATGCLNCGFSVFAGFAVFSVLGFMAHHEHKAVSDVVSQAIGLAFVAYPKAIGLLPYGARVFGVLFFLILLIAGLSSSMSILEAFTAAMIDKFEFSRKKVVTITAILGFLGSQIFVTGAGLYWLDIVDHFMLNYGLVLVGILECVLVIYFFNVHKLRKHINAVSSFKVGRLWEAIIGVLLPLMLGGLLVSQLWKDVHSPYGGYSWSAIIVIGLNWIMLTMLAALIFAWLPWKSKANLSAGRSDR